ncbi:Mo-dependent nitrogenase C-terminal domain-containing protein [Microcoleus vaginatus GB1-A2]
MGDTQAAQWWCQLIPAPCSFERNIQLLRHDLFHIPHLCKLNPVYDELMGLRFPSLSFLADPAEKRRQVSDSSRQQPKILGSNSSSQIYL